jgi:hypothetical protein
MPATAKMGCKGGLDASLGSCSKETNKSAIKTTA